MFNSSIGELFKLPDLLTHFTEHQTADKSIDLFDFISMHYVGDDFNDRDQDKDMQLPFKKITAPFPFQIGVMPDILTIPKEKISALDTYLQILFKNHPPKNPALAALFRPPCYA